MWIILINILISWHYCFCDDNDLFSSTADLTRLLHLETKFISNLNSLVEKLENEAKVIRSYLNSHRKQIDLTLVSDSYVSNPINSLYMIKRLSLDLERSKIIEILADNKTEEIRHDLFNTTASFPKKSDWEGASNGIFLLQEHYQLNISQLSNGMIEFDNIK